MSNTEILLPLLAGLVCSGIAFLALIGVVVLLIVNARRSRQIRAVPPDWPSVPGRIILARVEESARTRADEDTFYAPMIEFEYTVGGQAYTGRQAVGRPTNLELMAKRALAHYPPGIQVAVYYNPEKPDQARLLVR